MEEQAKQHQNWLQKNKQVIIMSGIVIVLVFATFALLIYVFGWDWTGFGGYNKVTTTHIISGTNAGTVTRTEEYQPGKGLWDWLQLLGLIAIPVVVGIGAAWFTARQNHDREIAEEQQNADRELAKQRYMDDRKLAFENQMETALQAYLDKMTELLLRENLSKLQRNDLVANIAETRTLLFLVNLDPQRKAYVIMFLAASGLIKNSGKIIDLNFADLREVNLRSIRKLDGISLEGANLKWADLTRGKLTNVNFQGADLKWAILSETDLRGADFNDANLSGADLCGANLSTALNLSKAVLSGARYNKNEIQMKNDQGNVVYYWQGEPVMIKPAQWPQEIDDTSKEKKGLICIDC